MKRKKIIDFLILAIFFVYFPLSAVPALFCLAWLAPEHDLRQITKDPAPDYHVKWSPDGKTLAFASKRAGNGNNDIWVKNVK